jgi:hypothetical protein
MLAGASVFRIVAIASVFLLGIYAFAGGVTTTEIDDLREQSVLAWIYYCAALFVLGGLDLGVPAGGPLLAQGALWITFFLAPAITATAVIEAAIRLLRPGSSSLQSLRGHAIHVGGGRLGQTYLEAILAVEPLQTVLHVVEADRSLHSSEHPLPANVHLVSAATADPATLDLMRLGHAEEMVVIADDDLSNLETAWAAKELAHELPVAVHVRDLALLRPVTRMIQDSTGSDHPLVFNTHRIAALQLYERLLHPHFENTGYRDVFIMGGFGGFAQTILELLRAMATEELQHVVIVDEFASARVRQFEADVPLTELKHSTIDGALEDPETWTQVEAVVGSMDVTPVYLLASANETVNFRTAMLLRKRAEEIRIFARCFRRTRFAETLAAQRSFELFAFEEVFQEALQDHFRNLREI